jgi:hypothetical protein
MGVVSSKQIDRLLQHGPFLSMKFDYSEQVYRQAHPFVSRRPVWPVLGKLGRQWEPRAGRAGLRRLQRPGLSIPLWFGAFAPDG